ncbi:hypothetical protein BLNAU_11671 [Blattamonas nauphoetae]|uniref:Uncharacterized protein n=1 Tax=Blattamonas nauphoetae TaxID=2049346 RepID=A0ABQ9XQA8_9EUKA|nr:hypothetical protein BLNAU_11671 [Blattamonas nauphoetae]
MKKEERDKNRMGWKHERSVIRSTLRRMSSFSCHELDLWALLKIVADFGVVPVVLTSSHSPLTRHTGQVITLFDPSSATSLRHSRMQTSLKRNTSLSSQSAFDFLLLSLLIHVTHSVCEINAVVLFPF